MTRVADIISAAGFALRGRSFRRLLASHLTPRRKPRINPPVLVEPLENRVLLSTTIINVNSFDDVIDPNDEVTTLREAIIQANTTAGDFVIQLQEGTYWLTLDGAGEDEAATGDLDILNNGRVTIIGAGAGLTIINAGGDDNGIPALGDRVFDVHEDAWLQVEGLTITGGTTTANLGDRFGGGIQSRRGNVTIIDSIISGNRAALEGGGIDNTGTLTVINSTISGNISGDVGGGIANVTGTVTVTNSTISGNEAEFGGGIRSAAGTFGTGTLTVTNSIISDNKALEEGGGITASGTVTISNSTISGNEAGIDGGGIYINRGSTTITNTTISGNETNGDGGGIANFGHLVITNSTIVLNRADANGSGSGTGGGIWTRDFETRFTMLFNTIVAGNLVGTGTEPNEFGGRDVHGDSASNLIGDAGSAGGLTDGFNGNIVGIDITAVLDTNLQNNGGPTPTHALVAGSPAINAGENSVVVLGANAVQTVRLFSPLTTNDFQLTFDGATTSSLPGDATAAQVQAALNALSSIGGVGGEVTVTKSADTFTVTFSGELAAQDVPRMTATGSASPEVNTIIHGRPPITTDQRGEGFPRISGGTVDIGAFEFAETQSLSPLEQINDQVEALFASGAINKGQYQALSLFLKENGGDIGRVNSFINRVEAFAKAGILSEADADDLLDLAQLLLIDLLI